MKIQCDVCGRDEASVFCCADEAALCDACDARVHRANKLAGKHPRFSLSSAAEQTQPLCDICKERRGFVFCQQDRAILCRDCDDPIHTANQLTMKHSRFLLTGARLSASPIPSKSVSSETDDDTNSNSNNDKSKPAAVVSGEATSTAGTDHSSSSISDYLIKTLPGYRVEDLLVDDADGFYKCVQNDDDLGPFSEAGLELEQEFPIWAPHVPQHMGVNGSVLHCDYGLGIGVLNQKQQNHKAKGTTRERWTDDSFMVPQINTTPAPSSNKRLRTNSSTAWGF